MNFWLWAALVMVLGFVPCGWVILRGKNIEGLVALQMATGLATLALLLIAQGLHRPSFFDLALALALLGVPSTLLFAHFFERWL
ncbi:MAG TPA: monovalent cation/H+ antiporter complex subunit F [Chthoniobacterales bacterium]|nr:monovalent cation/H+ antiporter complex subunit F [Chthoniobacterales bacterium]